MLKDAHRIRHLVDEHDADGLTAALNGEKAERSVLRRAWLVHVLGRSRSPVIVGPLSLLLEIDPDDDVRGLAAIALGRTGDLTAAPAVRSALDEPTVMGQMAAILALWLLRDRGGVSRLSERLLHSTSPEVRQFAAAALGDIGDSGAVPALIGALDDPKAGVRGAAAGSLGALGDARALEPLRLARQSAKGLSRRRIGKALDRLEGSSRLAWWRRVFTCAFSTDRMIAIAMRLMAAIQLVSSASKAMKIRGRKQRQLAASIVRGRRLFSSGREQETFDFLERAVKQFPEDAEIRWLYAAILLAFRPDDVAEQATKAVALAPNDPSILVRAGSLLLNLGEVEEARSCAARANQLAQPNFVLMSELANLDGCLAALYGEDDVAEEKLRAAVESDPSSSPFAIDLAKFLVRGNRREDAMAVVHEALRHVKDKECLEHLRQEIARDAGGS